MTRHSHARGVRMDFASAPDSVRDWANDHLGGDLSAVTDCVGGMSPGPAARLRSSSGRTAFVKACGPELNPVTPELLRDEARILACLPDHPNLPRLLDVYDDGNWVALLIEDLPGAVPDVPWSSDDLRRANDVLSALRPVLDGISADWVPLATENAPIFTDGWKLLADRLDQVDPWWARHHDALAAHAERAAALINGETLLHWDIRADNMIFGDGRDVLIDWGQVRRGADWIDHALLAMDCAMSGASISAATCFARQPDLADRDPSDLIVLMASAAMTLAARSTEEAPPGLPTIVATRARWAENLRRELESCGIR
ncbi:phosphotransferase family enzyme [Rudaeicoccus suwonensis]|uniref:Phosphotransferase family enzyme n=2 Tax=Rudaeicoccus suwonensis TaxID=657409 RepID=A0A561E775_9MICO|nr:phosphotransferase family enzyme [Rudaeicoccus suwonensis]